MAVAGVMNAPQLIQLLDSRRRVKVLWISIAPSMHAGGLTMHPSISACVGTGWIRMHVVGGVSTPYRILSSS